MSVLVIGGTGTVGPHVVRSLLARGAKTRVLTRDPDRARRLLPAGVDIRSRPPRGERVLRAAVDGVDAVFLLTSHDPRSTDMQLGLIRSLRRFDVRIVKVSGPSPGVSPDGPEALRKHWEVEQVLTRSGQRFVVLQPCSFMQSVIDRMVLPAFWEIGKVVDPLGPSGINLIDARDIGECGAEALTNPRWEGRTLVLTGPRAVTFAEIAEYISPRIGRKTETLQLTPIEVRRQLERRGMPRWEARHFQEELRLFRRGLAETVSPDVTAMIGRSPTSVDEYLATHPALQGAATVARRRDANR
jgi:NAD(P)H dehydrogenase (quinone)